MRERPIIFSGEMIRAILDGRKTQTRRIVTGTPKAMALLADCERAPEIEDIPDRTWMDTKHGTRARWQIRHAHESDDGIGDGMNAWCPYGHRWTRLWVRETHALIWPGESEPESVRDCRIEYRADTGAKRPGEWPDDSDDPACPKWKPSIYMPRWASRLTLEITGIRVERLQDISEADAIVEGVDAYEWSGGPANASAVGAYRELWDRLNEKRAPWSSNPWVWVVSFKRVDSETVAEADLREFGGQHG